jgi:MoaA/NifB/PqqE/SkfB family radical SAM enzyme
MNLLLARNQNAPMTGAENSCWVTSQLEVLWLELTGKCQLHCEHCYAESGPKGDHGSMATEEWLSLLDEARGLGVRNVQFIGGEPTPHPDLGSIVSYACSLNLGVEIYTNLVRVTPQLWEVFQQKGVRLATSYYSLDAGEHDSITRRRSHDKTLANIHEALKRDIELRVWGDRCASESESQLGSGRIGQPRCQCYWD